MHLIIDGKDISIKMFLIVLLWILLILYGVHYNKACDNIPFSFQNSMALRGICAIEIMIGHLGLPDATNSIFLYPNRKAGILFVGIFFALSGYGLSYSVRNKKGYMQHFLLKRIVKIVFPAYLIYIISVLVMQRAEFNGVVISQIFDMKVFFRSTNWYVWELILLYIVFYFCFKHLQTPWNMIGLFTFLIGFVITAFILKVDNPWYGSTLCFGVGVLYGEKHSVLSDKIKLFNCSRIIALGGATTVSIGLFFLLGEHSIIGNLIARNIASIAFVLMTIGILYRFSVGNSISFFLGKYSYEIFLIHPLFISVLRPYIANDLVYSVLVIACAIAFAYIFKVIWNFIAKTSILSYNTGSKR